VKKGRLVDLRGFEPLTFPASGDALRTADEYGFHTMGLVDLRGFEPLTIPASRDALPTKGWH
jgi:hypothetical protein